MISFAVSKNFLVWYSLICLCIYFCFPCPRRYIRKSITKRNVRVYCLCFLLALWFWVFHLSLSSILSLYGVRRWSFHFFVCICPIFPTLFIEYAVFIPLHVFWHRLSREKPEECGKAWLGREEGIRIKEWLGSEQALLAKELGNSFVPGAGGLAFGWGVGWGEFPPPFFRSYGWTSNTIIKLTQI